MSLKEKESLKKMKTPEYDPRERVYVGELLL